MAVFKEDINPARINDFALTQIYKRTEAADEVEDREEAVVEELKDVSRQTPSTINVMLCNTQARGMDRFLAAEQGYRYRMPICKEHQQITKNCPDCVAIDSQEVLDSETLNDKLYTSLYTVPDEKDPERFYIKSNLYFYEDHSEVGQLGHSAIV